MKTIYFIRHAKSSWDNPLLSDFDRPLNKRGLRDAPKMAKYLADLIIDADAIISSPANRAQTTARYFQEALHIDEKNFYLEEDIYEASITDLFEVIHQVSDVYETILVFGHNPAFTYIANFFTDDFLANVPTCGIVKIETTIKHWSQMDQTTGKLTAFYYPKMNIL